MERPTSSHQTSQSPIHPKTFVETDASNFKELVQRLTGPRQETATAASTQPSMPPQNQKVPSVKRSKLKIQERKQGLRPKLTIMKPNLSSFPSMGIVSPCTFSPNGYLCSPLPSPSSIFSLLGLSDDESNATNSNSGLDDKAEEEAIKEKRFYLHPSPRELRPGNVEPELLPLFPLSSPKTVES